jgi:hypothetical protein
MFWILNPLHHTRFTHVWEFIFSHLLICFFYSITSFRHSSPFYNPYFSTSPSGIQFRQPSFAPWYENISSSPPQLLHCSGASLGGYSRGIILLGPRSNHSIHPSHSSDTHHIRGRLVLYPTGLRHSFDIHPSSVKTLCLSLKLLEVFRHF